MGVEGHGQPGGLTPHLGQAVFEIVVQPRPGGDIAPRGGIRTGSVWVGEMTIAGE